MRLAFILLLGLVSHRAAAAADNPIQRPNIILMMADDMGMGDTSAYQDFTGNSDDDQIHTPNMERLARMGIRFTDAHTPASRCSPTRYALLTGRYPWRNRLKFWVLFGVQGDPMIERDRPTLGTLMQNHGYRTGLVGKWHVGLRYRQSDGRPADGWEDADLTQPMYDTPLDHGFDQCWFTSRSHGTSGPAVDGKKQANHKSQSIGPGHIHGRTIVGATGNGKQLVDSGPHAYVLHELGGRHSDHAIEFLEAHLPGQASADQPFFLYYPSNSNHGPHTPDSDIDGQSVKGAARSVSGQPLNTRGDYIFENDVALGRLIDFLETHDDPRRSGKKLIDNTIVIFTSDNGAEITSKIATGPFRSNKGSTYEGGHRVPLIVSWPAGEVGDGDAKTNGKSSEVLIGLQDMYATFAEVLGSELPDLLAGEKGAEDSVGVLDAWRGHPIRDHVMFFSDHKEAKQDNAAVAFRVQEPYGVVIAGEQKPQFGVWKFLFDAQLIRKGIANPIEAYNLRSDSREQENLVPSGWYQGLLDEAAEMAVLHRTAGGHRLANVAADRRVAFDFISQPHADDSVTKIDLIERFNGATCAGTDVVIDRDSGPQVRVTISATDDGGLIKGHKFNVNERGLGVDGNEFGQVDSGETIVVQFDRDVIVESAAIVAGNGVCGGFYQVGQDSPLAIYCVDADIDAKDQSGILSDIGVIKVGESLRLSSTPHLGVESPGRWRLAALNFRVVNEKP